MQTTTLSRTGLALAVCSLFLFAACGGGEKKPDPSPETETEETAETTSNSSVPFQILIEEYNDFSNLVGVHSASLGQASDGRWLIVGGRKNGFHGFSQPNEDFPYATANQDLMVFDPSTNALSSMNVSSLNNAAAALALSASNAQHVQDGSDLYICGGYAQDESIDSTLTLRSMVQINIDAFADAIVANDGAAAMAALAMGGFDHTQVAGGELFKLSDGYFYLVFGHRFNGLYSTFQAAKGAAKQQIQTYTDEVRRFHLQAGSTAGTLELTDYEAYTDNGWTIPQGDTSYTGLSEAEKAYFASRYHRRDLNIMPTIVDANGTEGLGAYSGVFTCPDPPSCNNSGVFVNPIYITPGTTPTITVDENFSQFANAYACWNMAMYDPTEKQMYNTFFGGITVQNFQPFTDSVSTVVRDVNTGATNQVINTTIKAGSNYVGSEGELVLSKQASLMYNGSNEIWDLSAMGDTTMIGYLYGGIASPAINTNNGNQTLVNDQVFTVKIVKAQTN